MNWLPLTGLALVIAAPAVKESGPRKAELPAIVGEWECVGFVGGGQALGPADRVPAIVCEFTADGKFMFREDGKAGPAGTYSIDASKDPAEVDYAAGRTRPNHGIYKVEKDKATRGK